MSTSNLQIILGSLTRDLDGGISDVTDEVNGAS